VNIFITGINGFLGRSMARHFRSRGHAVRGSARNASAGVVALRLGEAFDPDVFRGSDAVIHAAHDFTAGAKEKNIRGTRAWFEAAPGARQAFLSSYSARPDAASEYGETKYAIEKIFLESGQAVVRPGLVIGNGGLFARQRAALRKLPVVPLIGGGTAPVAVIGIGHFLDALAIVVEQERAGAFNLFYGKQPSAREFVRAVKGGRGWVLPVPAGLALRAAQIVQALHLPLPVNPGQIRALAANASSPWPSDLGELLPGRDCEFCLEHALGDPAAESH
jgi:nucleoside-diphosphate-sugar epimerase